MKKVLKVLLSFVLCFTMLFAVACGNNNNGGQDNPEKKDEQPVNPDPDDPVGPDDPVDPEPEPEVVTLKVVEIVEEDGKETLKVVDSTEAEFTQGGFALSSMLSSMNSKLEAEDKITPYNMTGYFADEGLTKQISGGTLVRAGETYYVNRITERDMQKIVCALTTEKEGSTTIHTAGDVYKGEGAATANIIAVPQLFDNGTEDGRAPIALAASSKIGTDTFETVAIDETHNIQVAGKDLQFLNNFDPDSFGFARLANLEKVILPDTIRKFGDYAFYGCYNLTNVSMAASINDPSGTPKNNVMGTSCFENCVALTEFNIPEGVSFLKQKAFKSCAALTTVKMPTLSLANLDKDGKKTGDTGVGDLQVAIPKSMFENCTSLTNIVIPENVTAVRAGAFKGCSSLTRINLPNGLKIVEKEAFKSCELGVIIIPSTVTTIGDAAFRANASKNVKIYIEITKEDVEALQTTGKTEANKTNLGKENITEGLGFADVDNIEIGWNVYGTTENGTVGVYYNTYYYFGTWNEEQRETILAGKYWHWKNNKHTEIEEWTEATAPTVD